MEDIYTFTLDSDTFERVLSGKKTVQILIHDAKHRVYEVGNQITFNREVKEDMADESNSDIVMTQKAVIENLLYFANFNEAIETIGKEKCGFKPNAPLEKSSDQFLSQEKYEAIEKNGLVALVFKTI